jgi:hypothetical protein
MVLLIDVWSNSVCETVPGSTHGETISAGTRTPYRPNICGSSSGARYLRDRFHNPEDVAPALSLDSKVVRDCGGSDGR